jgi:putative aldouronate transport system permease protein
MISKSRVKVKKRPWKDEFKVNWQLYILVFLPVIYILLFKYVPMYGVQIAFRKFIAVKGILGSPWVGLKYFKKFFESYQFERVLINTFAVSFYQLIAGFPFPIILALALNNAKSLKYKKNRTNGNLHAPFHLYRRSGRHDSTVFFTPGGHCE